jgi:hypothetical protein
MGDHDVTMDEILLSAPRVLGELAGEFTRRADEEYRKDEKSQVSACFFLALRSISLLCSMGTILKPETSDGVKVLMRAFLEARDLLMTFRFDDQAIRNKIDLWFQGNVENTWKPEHKRCEGHLEKLGYRGADLAKKWSQTTTLAHPTRFAAQNSAVCVTRWAIRPTRMEDFHTVMEPEVADYLTSIASLIVMATYDIPGLISLGCDLRRMPNIDAFRENVFSVAVPILNKRDSDLPPGSYRS